MIIEIEDAQTEAMIAERIASGAFKNVQEVVRFALSAAPAHPAQGSAAKTWREVIESAQAIGGVDLDISRNRSTGRPVDLS